jgi:uncharacterized protein
MADEITRIGLKVQPNAGCNKIMAFNNGVFKVKIAAPPDKGKANKAIIEYLSDILDLPKNHVLIERGETSHNKLISIIGLNQESVLKILNSLVESKT